MSNYTVPSTQTDDVLITTSIWNTQVVENLKALYGPPTIQYKADEGSDYTTTSTSFTNIDVSPVNGSFSLQLTLDSVSDVQLSFNATLIRSGGANGNAYFDFTVDGSQWGTNDGVQAINFNTLPTPITVVALITAQASGTHTYNMQWKTGGSVTALMYAGAGTVGGDMHPQMSVVKI